MEPLLATDRHSGAFEVIVDCLVYAKLLMIRMRNRLTFPLITLIYSDSASLLERYHATNLYSDRHSGALSAIMHPQDL